MYDVCIIGGGASGISCAITAARMGLSCIILEKEAKLGKKIYATGNGRCNITNRIFDDNYALYYNSDNDDYVSFLNKLFDKKNPDKEIIDFFYSVGIVTYDIDNYVYPHSLQSSSVMWALTDSLKKYGVKTHLKTRIDDINQSDGFYTVYTPNEQIKALNVVLACGGKSYKSLGGSDAGYKLADKLNLGYTDLRPALCGLNTKEDMSSLAGVRVKAKATLYSDNKKIADQEGEIQFNDYGLSGIMIFNLSGKAGKVLKNGEKPYVSIDFIPDVNDSTIFELFELNKFRKAKAILNNLINDKLAGYIIDNTFFDDIYDSDGYNKDYILALIKALHSFKLEITGLRDFDNAQVTAGGISLDIINPKDMSIKDKPGLYAVGELTDIDGLCGGYNLTYAIISGIRAGKGIYDKIKSN